MNLGRKLWFVARVLNLKTYELELREQSRGGIGEVGESTEWTRKLRDLRELQTPDRLMEEE